MAGATKAQRIAARGIKIRCATAEDQPEIWRILRDQFMPNEPFSNSIGAVRNKTFLDRMSRDMIRTNGVIKCTKQPRTSLVAVNDKGEVIAAKMGYYKRWEDPQKSMVDDLPLHWLDPFTAVLPAQFAKILAFSELLEKKTRYDAHMTMEDLGCKSLYVGDFMSVHEDYQGLGLGEEMVRQTIDLAREHGCTHYMAVVTGKFSQGIYRKFNFKADCQWYYNEEKDKYGNLVIDQPGVHTHVERVTRAVDID